MLYSKVSIITASYNSEATLEATIESVYNQTYQDIEYIIIDGGSSDKTVSIIQKFEPLFSGRLKWISEPDKGIYDAWNKGLEIATGEWIAFLGSDDIYLPDSIHKYMNVLISKKCVNFISSKCKLVNSELKTLMIYGKPWGKLMNSYCCIAHVGCMHKRCLFDNYGSFNSDYKIAGDYDFLLRVKDVIIPYYLPEITAIVQDGGISNRNILKVCGETLKIKVSHKTKNLYFSLWDYCVDVLKYYVRSFMIK